MTNLEAIGVAAAAKLRQGNPTLDDAKRVAEYLWEDTVDTQDTDRMLIYCCKTTVLGDPLVAFDQWKKVAWLLGVDEMRVHPQLYSEVVLASDGKMRRDWHIRVVVDKLADPVSP